MRRIAIAIIFAFILSIPLSASAEDKLKVVASFSIIGDLVSEVAGDNINLQVLVGSDGDVHKYEPTPADAKTIANADIIFINGFGLEGWIERLIKSSGYKGQVVVLSEGITPLILNGHDDPHAWQDPQNAKIYITHIRDSLMKADKLHAKKYQEKAVGYAKKLDALDKWIKQKVSEVSVTKRKVVSVHDAFQYFGARYGIQFIPLLGITTESDASAADLAHIVDQIRKNNITAVFLENMTDSRLIEQLESDAGAHVGGTLYSDALSLPEGPAPDYAAMLHHNVNELVVAMQKNP